MNSSGLDQVLEYLSKTSLVQEMQAQQSQIEGTTFSNLLSKIKNKDSCSQSEILDNLQRFYQCLMRNTDRVTVNDKIRLSLARLNFELIRRGYGKLSCHY